MQQRIISRVIGNLVERPAVEVPYLRARQRSQFLSETKNIFEAKKNVSTTCQTRLNIFLLNPLGFTNKRKQK